MLLLEPGTYAHVATLMQGLEDDGVWKKRVFDLTAYAGQGLVLYFEVYNTSTSADGRTWMFLDDVSLQSCTGITPTATPTATDTPTATYTPTPTATPSPTPVSYTHLTLPTTPYV